MRPLVLCNTCCSHIVCEWHQQVLPARDCAKAPIGVSYALHLIDVHHAVCLGVLLVCLESIELLRVVHHKDRTHILGVEKIKKDCS